jgi:putative spermidine/putrescine transport system substrate-binding protein
MTQRDNGKGRAEGQAKSVNRREILKRSLAVSAVGLAAPLIFPRRAFAADRSKQLVVVHWGGAGGDANRKAYFEPFSKEMGIEIIEETGPGMEKVKAQVDAGKVSWDLLIDIGRFRMFQGAQQGLLEKIDYNVVTNVKDIIQDGAHAYGVASNVGSEVISYNTTSLGGGKHPRSWAEFWDVKGKPGHRAMQMKAYGNLEIALVADGVAPDKIYPIDVERAFAKLDQIKPHIDVWTTSYAQPIRLMTDGEVDVSPAWNARVSAAVADGAPLSIEWNQGFIYYDMWSVPKGAPNAAAAMRFINFCLDPQRQANFSTLYPYGPSNRKAIPLLSAEARAKQPTAPENLKKQIVFNDEWWASRLTELTDRFTLWAAKK